MNNEALTAIRSLMGFFMLIILLALIVGVLLFSFWIWMMIDCAKRNFKRDNDKVVWILVLIFLSFLGAIIYYFVVKVGDKKRKK